MKHDLSSKSDYQLVNYVNALFFFNKLSRDVDAKKYSKIKKIFNLIMHILKVKTQVCQSANQLTLFELHLNYIYNIIGGGISKCSVLHILHSIHNKCLLT